MGKATRESYGEALLELGEKNENIVVLDADLSKSTKTCGFASKYPERFFNMGIAEQNLMGTAAGLSAMGKVPFASTFAVFAAGRAFEIIRNSICYPNQNVKIAATHAGITVGEDGASHQSIEDIALMSALPNMTVLVPADAVETKKAVKAAASHKGPVYIRLGRLATSDIFDESYDFQIGKGVELKEGNDIAIIATGMMTAIAIEAQEMLLREGISARIINMPSIKPIDKTIIIKAAKETKAIVTIEEHSIIGGLGSAVCDVLSENCPTIVKKIGINDTFGQSGDPKDLMEKYGLTKENICSEVKRLLSKIR